MEGPPLNEFSRLVAPDLFDRYPDFEPHARSDNGSLVVAAPMPSGHGTIFISVLDMPMVRVEIFGCPESSKEFDDPDATFDYVDQLRIGTREPMEQFQDYDSGGVAVLTYRYDAEHEPVMGFRFEFTTVEGDVPEEVAIELSEQEILPRCLLIDYFFHARQCIGFVVHENASTSLTEDIIPNLRYFLNSDIRVESVTTEPLADDRTLVDADLRFLASEDEDLRFTALSAIVGHARLHRRRAHFGQLMDMIVPLFDSPDAAVREEVAKASSALASAGPDFHRSAARTLFTRAIRDSQPDVRACVARNAAPLLYPIAGTGERMPEEEQADFAQDLFPLLEDTDQGVVEMTIANLGIFDTPIVTAKLLELTNADANRANAILGLQRRALRPDDVVPRLLAICADETIPATDRACALETLGHYAAQSASPQSASPQSASPQSASPQSAPRQFVPRIETAILTGLAGPEPMLNFGALRALLPFAPSEVPEARILELASSPDEDVRAQSFLTIVARKLESDEAFATVWSGCQAINTTIRQCAEHAWNELFPGRRPVEPDED